MGVSGVALGCAGRGDSLLESGCGGNVGGYRTLVTENSLSKTECMEKDGFSEHLTESCESDRGGTWQPYQGKHWGARVKRSNKPVPSQACQKVDFPVDPIKQPDESHATAGTRNAPGWAQSCVRQGEDPFPSPGAPLLHVRSTGPSSSMRGVPAMLRPHLGI